MITKGETKAPKAHSLTDEQISYVTQTLLFMLFSTIQYYNHKVYRCVVVAVFWIATSCYPQYTDSKVKTWLSRQA